ncbi:GlxA family transcriptional regulator [Acidisoma cellulosilytica]|uniref:GlxA family transcriptional regulator n=1 Tax=Acidisoma cellulosilyticum TaxID=2802395 RepID=A0A963YYT3_9PROT|nr:GlxA family transcriptional regulator [Acidisoma cellulosilyticum]MCB8878847.1 GlxA family transcriptional regulator [Acidisoma cellulosilyticum]
MRDVAFVVYPGYSVMALAVVTAFEVANMVADDPPYDLHFVSETGGMVRTSAGMMLESEAFTAMPFDTLVVGGATIPAPSTPGLIAYMRDAPKRHRRIAAVCTGAFVLAEAGLLDGRQATTHWLHARELQRQFPKVKIDQDRIFMNDGPIWTSAGMTAGLDLGLALIENDLGPDLAKSVARKLVIYHRRGGGQSQFSTLLELAPKSDRIQTALTYARDNLHKPLTVPDLAEAAHLSPRQFSRAFQAETGQSPAKAIENLRVEAARTLMEQSRHPIDVVAQQTGFSDRDHLRRAFLRAFGQPPQVLRRNARLEAIDYQDSAEAAHEAAIHA